MINFVIRFVVGAFVAAFLLIILALDVVGLIFPPANWLVNKITGHGHS